MKRDKTKSRILTTLLVISLVHAAVLPAIAADPVTITTTALKEVESIDAQGNKTIERVPVGQVLPGDTTVFVNMVQNNTAKIITGVKVDNPIPANMIYIDGSASAKNAALTFSVDGGKSYDIPGKLFVIQPDGKPRQAGPEDFTDIRWTLLTPLAPQANQQIEFQAIVK